MVPPEPDERVKKRFVLNGIKDSILKISITDPLGYIIKTIILEGNESKTFDEMIDRKGYLIVETQKENYKEPYFIVIGD